MSENSTNERSPDGIMNPGTMAPQFMSPAMANALLPPLNLETSDGDFDTSLHTGNDDPGFGFGRGLENDDGDLLPPNKRWKATNETTDDGSEHVQNYYTLSRDQTAANDDSMSRLRALGDPPPPHQDDSAIIRWSRRASIRNLQPSVRTQPATQRRLVSTTSSRQPHNRLNTEQIAAPKIAQQSLPEVFKINGGGPREDISAREHIDCAGGATLAPMRHKVVSSGQDNTNLEPEEVPHKKLTRHQVNPESDIQLQRAATRSESVESQGSSLTCVTTNTDTQQKKLIDRIRFLEKENARLKNPEAEMNILFIYHIMDYDDDGYENDSTAYLDAPQWSIGGGPTFLRGAAPLADIEGYIQRMTGIAFVVNKYYNARQQTREIEESERNKTALPSPVPISETVSLKSNRILEAMTAYMKQGCGFMDRFPDFDPHRPIVFPYIFWFWDRRTKVCRNLGPEHQKYLFTLTTWIENNYCDLYDRVEKELSEAIVSSDSIPFLFTPGETVVIRKEQTWVAGVVTYRASHKFTELHTVSEYQSVKADDDSSLSPVPHLHDRSMQKTFANRPAESSSKNTKPHEVWSVKYWTYAYDGSFYRDEQRVDVLLPTAEQKGVRDLDAYPLKYASDDVRNLLEQRGRIFWKCRHRKFISYEDESGPYGNTERFMVDFGTYRQLHSNSSSFKTQYPFIDNRNTRRMSAHVMDAGHPPQGAELYAFPATIVGYNLRNKKWIDLEVDRIRDVTWNKQSFARLVIDDMTKELIQALITNQIDRDQSTDIVANKGNGLIILLHGGPGTGKTLTAESVAETAEKPLFRVTCGDIGTKPEEVEKYLESVFHLSKTWDAVVLLDEADVFLEQRTHSNLERNALVSVFLRVLEYHEGILVLTSNRVGTFDEAFKSRIQLALHYESLTQSQRHKIWKNFFNHLKDMESPNREHLPQGEGSVQSKDHDSLGIDFEDIDCCLSELAEYEMNGRQIRNAITTARQLAKFKKELMKASHIKHAIEVSSKFDKYLSDVHEGFSDEQIARGDGIR